MSTAHEERIEGVAALSRSHDLRRVRPVVTDYTNSENLFPGLFLLLVRDHSLLGSDDFVQSLLVPGVEEAFLSLGNAQDFVDVIFHGLPRRVEVHRGTEDKYALEASGIDSREHIHDKLSFSAPARPRDQKSTRCAGHHISAYSGLTCLPLIVLCDLYLEWIGLG